MSDEGQELPRRADWRWLLPTYAPRRVLCLANGDLAQSARVTFGKTAYRYDECASRAGGGGAYDLVVVARLDAPTLRVAHAALDDDGILYAECARGPSAGALRRRLRDAGFADVQLVAPWPATNAPQLWMPLGSRIAAWHLLNRLPLSARHPLRRLWLATQRLAFVARAAMGHPAVVAIVARARTTHAASASSRMAPWWVQETVPGPRAGSQWLLLTPGRGAEARAIGLVVACAGDATAAVKLARTPASSERMHRGAAVLERLRSAGITGRGLAPEPLGRLYSDGGRVLATVEEAIHGRWLDAALSPRTLARTTEQVTEWLVTLALATRGPARDDAWERAFRPMVERFRSVCGDLVDRALLERAVALLRTVGPLPTVLAHRDFRPWNLYVTPARRLVAFDWDMSDVDGLPALDLLHCHAYLAFALDGTMRTHRFGEAQQRAEAGRLGRVRRACEARYAAAVGIGDAHLRAVRAFAWMAHGVDAAEEWAARGRPLRRTDVPATVLSLWEVEARRALA